MRIQQKSNVEKFGILIYSCFIYEITLKEIPLVLYFVLISKTEAVFPYPIILAFHTVHGVLKERILKWFVIPFSSRPRFV